MNNQNIEQESALRKKQKTEDDSSVGVPGVMAVDDLQEEGKMLEEPKDISGEPEGISPFLNNSPFSSDGSNGNASSIDTPDSVVATYDSKEFSWYTEHSVDGSEFEDDEPEDDAYFETMTYDSRQYAIEFEDALRREEELARQRQREEELARQRQIEEELARQRQREAEVARQRQREAELARQRQREAELARQREEECKRFRAERLRIIMQNPEEYRKNEEFLLQRLQKRDYNATLTNEILEKGIYQEVKSFDDLIKNLDFLDPSIKL